MSLSDKSNTEQLAMPVPSQPHRPALEERCPKCGALPGDRCVTDNGGTAYYEHLARRQQARYLPIGGR